MLVYHSAHVMDVPPVIGNSTSHHTRGYVRAFTPWIANLIRADL